MVPSNEPFFIGGHGGGDMINTYSQDSFQADNPGGGLLEGIGPAPIAVNDFRVGGMGTQMTCGPLGFPDESPISFVGSGGTEGAFDQADESCDGIGSRFDGADRLKEEARPEELPTTICPTTCSSSPNSESARPIRYANGEIRLIVQDLLSFGYGHEWGHTRSYSNQLNANSQGPNGDRWFVKQMPHIEENGSGNVAVIGVINDTVWFDEIFGNYVAEFFVQDTLEHDGTNNQFIYRNLRGEVFKFFDFSTNHPTATHSWSTPTLPGR